MAKNKHGLTKQQQGFCDDLRSSPDMSATKAYLKNYKVKSDKVAQVCASKLLSNTMVQKYLAVKQVIAELKADYDQADWVKDILMVKRMCMADEDITLVVEKLDENNIVHRLELKQREFNPAGAIKALETLGKFKKWLSDKQEVSLNHIDIDNTFIIQPVSTLDVIDE